jgi:leucyl/phenylalanyl-tRNA--protein transferase
LDGEFNVSQAVPRLTPDLVLRAYAAGVFPMAESREDPRLYWIDPEWRTIFPMDGFHISRRLARSVRAGTLKLRIDAAFSQVIRSCAEPVAERKDSWINSRIIELYEKLFAQGHAHSVECWKDDRLVGGLYGLALGGAFFGESMFSRERDASKVALVHLYERLRARGFTLFDVQFMTEHLRQFGAIEIPRADYLALLDAATSAAVRF